MGSTHSLYYTGSFLKKIYENFVRTLETVHNNRGVCIREESVPRGSTVVQQEKEKSICGVFTSSITRVYVLHKMSSEANVIIFSSNHYCILNILLKIFCSFLFLPFNGSQEFAFRRVEMVHNPSIKVYSCQFM